MKKQAILLISILLATVLTACNGSQEQRSSNSETPAVGKITYKGATSVETFLIGLDGRPINVSEITSLTDKNFEPTSVLDKENFSRAECNGLAYAFEPNLVLQESENPELFDNDYYIGEKVQVISEFIRVNEGDEFNGLTVKTARAVFSTLNTDIGEGYYYEGSELQFDGKITLTGWITISEVNEKYPNVVLDMTFYCDSNNKLPLSLSFSKNQKYGYYHIPWKGWKIYTDIPEISLGKYPDYDIDFQGLKEGDAWVKVEITVTDIKMVCGIQGDTDYVTATLSDITLL